MAHTSRPGRRWILDPTIGGADERRARDLPPRRHDAAGPPLSSFPPVFRSRDYWYTTIRRPTRCRSGKGERSDVEVLTVARWLHENGNPCRPHRRRSTGMARGTSRKALRRVHGSGAARPRTRHSSPASTSSTGSACSMRLRKHGGMASSGGPTSSRSPTGRSSSRRPRGRGGPASRTERSNGSAERIEVALELDSADGVRTLYAALADGYGGAGDSAVHDVFGPPASGRNRAVPGRLTGCPRGHRRRDRSRLRRRSHPAVGGADRPVAADRGSDRRTDAGSLGGPEARVHGGRRLDGEHQHARRIRSLNYDVIFNQGA